MTFYTEKIGYWLRTIEWALITTTFTVRTGNSTDTIHNHSFEIIRLGQSVGTRIANFILYE